MIELNSKTDDRWHFAERNLPKQLCARKNLHVLEGHYK